MGGCGGNIAWHTENDTLDIADKDILMTDMKIYALAVLRNANAEILPYDWRAVTQNFADTLQRYGEAAGEHFDFGPAEESVERLQSTLERFYRAVEEGAVAKDEANEAILELARGLVPVNFTQHPRFFHDPALTLPPLPDLAVALELNSHQGDTLGFAQTELMRGQNRLVSTLRHATRRLERALA